MDTYAFEFPVPDNLLPRMTPDNAPYWQAAARDQLVMPHCEGCGRAFFPLSPRCPGCLSDRITFNPVVHEGRISSWVRYRKSYYPWTEGVTPYVVALLDIVPGVRLPMLMHPAPQGDPEIGGKVKITFLAVGNNQKLPVCSAV